MSSTRSSLGTLVASLSGVTIAIPVMQGRISPVLDTATRLLVATCRRGKETVRREIVLCPLPPEKLARALAELNADVLLCAALSEPLRQALRRAGVRVRPHLCGEIELVLRAFRCGQLARNEFRMPGCWGLHVHGVCLRRRPIARETSETNEHTEKKLKNENCHPH